MYELDGKEETLQVGGFLPGVKQIANVAALPGEMAMDDAHCKGH